MSEMFQFQRIYTLPNDLYDIGSPLVISSGALLLDKQTAKFLVQLKLKNITSKTLVSAVVKIVEMDSNNEDLGTATEFVYSNFSAAGHTVFGSQTPIFVTNSNTRSFKVALKSVLFADGTKLNFDDLLLSEPLPAPYTITSTITNWLGSNEAVSEYRATLCQEAGYRPAKYKDLWICTCGTFNTSNEIKCHHCNSTYEKISSVDPQALKKEYIYKKAVALMSSSTSLNEAIKLFESISDWKDSKAKIEKCKSLILQHSQKKAKIKKIAIISSLVTAASAVIVALIILFINVIIPSIQIAKANNLYEKEDYKSAANIASKYITYSVSSEKANEILEDLKNEVEKLIENGDYTQASNLSQYLPTSSTTKKAQLLSQGRYGEAAREYSMKRIVIPEGTTAIEASALSSCYNLEEVVLPESLKSIGNDAFNRCTKLTNITIPDSVTSIGRGAFAACSKLTIYAQATEKPAGWDSNWNRSNCPVVWGYNPE